MEYREYLPEILRGIADFQGLGTSLDPETEPLREKMREAAGECFAETASEEGIARFEHLLGIRAGAEDSLEIRRARVMGRFQGLPPFSIGWLREMLTADCGADGFSVSQNTEECWLRVRVTQVRENYAEMLGEKLREQIPAAIVLRMGVLHRQRKAARLGVLMQVGTKWSWKEKKDGAV